MYDSLSAHIVMPEVKILPEGGEILSRSDAPRRLVSFTLAQSLHEVLNGRLQLVRKCQCSVFQ